MRQITHLVVHCAATKPGQDVGAAEIRRWHVEGNGWADIGYHYIIRLDGTVETGRPLERAGAHVAGHNAKTVGICLVGGLDDKGRPHAGYTREQYQALRTLLGELREQFPRAHICGHRDFPGVAKDCPCFDVRGWCAQNGIDPEPPA